MKKVIKGLEKLILKRFKLNLVIEGLEDKLFSIVRKRLMDQYSGVRIKRDNRNFTLGGIRCQGSAYNTDIKPVKINITLTYFNSDDLGMKHLEKLKELKSHYNKHAYVSYLEAANRIQLCVIDNYSIDIDRVFEDDLNLEIKGRI